MTREMFICNRGCIPAQVTEFQRDVAKFWDEVLGTGEYKVIKEDLTAGSVMSYICIYERKATRNTRSK